MTSSAANKKTLYVGGLEDNVTEKMLNDLFTPFGDVLSVLVPMDEKSGKTKGFAFVEFEEPEDAYQAIENLNKAEFFGRVLSVNFAKPDAVAKNKAIWEQSGYHEKPAEEGEKKDEMEVEEEEKE